MRVRLAIALILCVLLASMANLGLLNLPRMAQGVANVWKFTSSLFPPEASVLETVLLAMLETLQIAFVGTVLGAVLALPLSLLATRGLFTTPVTEPVRVLLAVVRTIPALLWGIIFVIAIGLGPGAGSLGIALYTLGYLGKLFYETFEGVDPEVMEGVRSVGCGPAHLASFAVLPEAANNLLAQLLFMYEYNVRSSSIMGFVGAGGIGYYLLGYIQVLRYDALMTAILVTLVVVMAIDFISARLRSMFWIGGSAQPTS